jgi:hypothetical protein
MHILLSSVPALYRKYSYPDPPIQYTPILPVNPDNCITFQQVQVLNRGVYILEISFRLQVNFNRSIQRINLVGHKIGDSETRGDSEGMDHFPVGSIIEPGQVVVIANQGL